MFCEFDNAMSFLEKTFDGLHFDDLCFNSVPKRVIMNIQCSSVQGLGPSGIVGLCSMSPQPSMF